MKDSLDIHVIVVSAERQLMNIMFLLVHSSKESERVVLGGRI